MSAIAGEIGVTDDWVRWRFKNGHEPLGDFGERLWQRIMVGCGLFYIPLKDLPAIGGKGPRLQGNGAILPDFDVSGRRRAYVDSKCKSGPVLYRKANEWRHGIDRKCWEAYEAISGVNRQLCVLAIAEIFQSEEAGSEWSGALLMQSLGKLGGPMHGFSNQGHMVYWPRNRFVMIAAGNSPSTLYGLASGQKHVDSDLRATVVRFFEDRQPAIQCRMF